MNIFYRASLYMFDYYLIFFIIISNLIAVKLFTCIVYNNTSLKFNLCF
ncbi:hypothetical protein SAMN05216436_111146 [bacterium A37T11]|nr:hypothetical protein SAMN05216436_111146 [bacterium A37T11]